jgi:hypothetical protein
VALRQQIAEAPNGAQAGIKTNHTHTPPTQ